MNIAFWMFYLSANLTLPPEAPVLPVPPEYFPVLQQLALSWELLDKRECAYTLNFPPQGVGWTEKMRRDYFYFDVRLIRKRYVELETAPMVSDSKRFPEWEMTGEACSFNRSYANTVQGKADWCSWHREYYQEVLRETNVLYEVWDSCRDARCPYYYITVRRKALMKLRDLLGEENYYAGNLPPYVPVWAFTKIER